MTWTWAPVASRISGPTAQPGAVGAVEHDPQRAGRDRLGQAEPVVDVLMRGSAPVVDHPAHLGVRDAAELLGPPDQPLELILHRRRRA